MCPDCRFVDTNEADRRRKYPPEGLYANYFEVGFNSLEFLIDFGQAFEGGSEPRIHIRIVTNPEFAWLLQGMLTQALAQYQMKHGPIPGAGKEIG
jgi:Protein of unknown function (DUF3467)